MQKLVIIILVSCLIGCADSQDNNAQIVNEALAIANQPVQQTNVERGTINEEIRQGLAKCVAIDGSLSRLDCFDSLVKSLGLVESTTSQGQDNKTGGWRTNITTNPLDDSRTVTLSLSSNSGVSRFGKRPSMIIRCQSNTTEMYITWHDYLGSEADVTSRVGDEAAQTRRWGLSTDNEATFYPGTPIAFLKKIMAVDEFVAQVTPYNESPVTAVFEVSGLTEAIQPLRETCSW